LILRQVTHLFIEFHPFTCGNSILIFPPSSLEVSWIGFYQAYFILESGPELLAEIQFFAS